MNRNKLRSIEDLLMMSVKQFQKKLNFEKLALHLKRMRKQNKKLLNDKHQLRKIFLNVDDLMLKYGIKFNNKYDFKLIFR